MKRNIGSKNVLYPTPAVVVGAMNGDVPTWTLVAHIGIPAHDRVMVSLAKPHFINHLVREAGTFSINLVDEAWKSEGHASWEDYVGANCLEITCGEAPYLVSRYDTTTGEAIPPSERIGLLDRKIHVINRHVGSPDEWLRWVRLAYQHTYGYEWQGDNLLLARMNLLASFAEYHSDRFGQQPPESAVAEVAEIISWNLWQMDGLKGVVPDSCHDVVSKHKPAQQLDFFAMDAPQERQPKVTPCPGCAGDNIYRHNGRYCRIRDWDADKTIRFIDLIK
jgi:hypothetical protein